MYLPQNLGCGHAQECNLEPAQIGHPMRINILETLNGGLANQGRYWMPISLKKHACGFCREFRLGQIASSSEYVVNHMLLAL